MPGKIGAGHLGDRVTERGKYDLTIKSAVAGCNQYDGGAEVTVTWTDSIGRRWLDRIPTDENNPFAWKLGKFLAGIGLSGERGAAWDEAEWPGRTSHVTLEKNAKGYLYARSYEPIDAPEGEEEIPF